MRMRRLICVVIVCSAVSSLFIKAGAQTPAFRDESLPIAQRVDDLLGRMTVDEKIDLLRATSPANERLGIAKYYHGNEALHGVVRPGRFTVFPQAIALASSWDPDLLYKVSTAISDEARARWNELGEGKLQTNQFSDLLTFWSPTVNMARDPRWGRTPETYGEDPFLTAENGKAYVRGLQGDGERLMTAACAKHFAVHSGPEAMRHSFDAQVSAKEMEETYLPAFEALVKEAKVEGVMGAYNRVNGEPACASGFLMIKLQEWGFDGYFVSDCWAINDFHTNHHVTATAVESAAMALKAGCDVNCGCTYMNLLAALDEGLITKEDIRKACVHLMRTRIRLGMFDKHNDLDDIPYTVVSCDEHKAVSLECAEKSIVLLKNNGILPLDESRLKTIAVIGPNADSRAALEGNYNGRADRYVTFLDGIRERFGGRVIFAEGCHLYKDKVSVLAQPGDRYAEAIAAAECADAVILCVGLDATVEGEEGDTGNEFSSGDKNDLRLPPPQRELVNKILALGKPTVTVVAAGSSINTESEPDALLHAWYPGSEGGTALAEILFGDISPSGKLPVTFYESTEKLPDFTDYSMKDRTYRFTEENVLFPFGFGLTYGDIRVTGLEYIDGFAEITAENAGNTASEDVIQLYIKDNSEYAVPYESLCGFKRIRLGAGETARVQIPVPERAFTAVNDKGERARYGTKFTLWAGTHRPDALSVKLSGTECVSTEI